jgi:DNA-binding NarL/FixJ family response regulator
MISLTNNSKKAKKEQLNVLIIDDCISIARKLYELISENKLVHVLGQAKSVREGLDMITKLSLDVVFLDINLPDGTGMEVLVYLKKIKPSVKVIVFSNSANNLYKRKFTENGSDYFLDKSKDFATIPELVLLIITQLNSKL